MRRIAIAGVIGVAAVAPHAALAQDFDYQVKVDAAIARACAGQAGQEIAATRIAQALLIETEEGVGQTAEQRALASVASPDELVDRASNQRNRLRGVRSLLLTELATPGSAQAKALLVTPPPPAPDSTLDNNFMFKPNTPYRFICAAKPPPKPVEYVALNTFAVRKGVDELVKLGSERKSAGSAQLVFDDFRTTNLAGEEKRTRKLIIDAAVGIPVLSRTEDRYAMLFGDYSRSRVRVRTAPLPTAPEKDGSADDVDALELGILGTTRIGDYIRTTGRVGYIIDSVTSARYIAGGLTLTPITGGRGDLGLCNFGAFKAIGLGMEARCTASAEADLRQVVKSGTAKLSDADRLFAVGGSGTITFRRGLDINGKPQDGLVANLTYRYLDMVSGKGPDIDRFESSLVWRWWAGDVGFDIGITYFDGIERKSLADEHRFGFTFGVIY
jgi:hypothetical protein